MSEKWQITASVAGDGRLIIEDADNNATICAMSLRGCEGRVDEMTRRAQIIAAAPEMLALLKTSRRNLSSIIAACNCNTYDPWLAEMDRVIAMAEGGVS